MIIHFEKARKSLHYRILSAVVLCEFLVSVALPPQVVWARVAPQLVGFLGLPLQGDDNV